MEIQLSSTDVSQMDKRYRVNLINSLSGFKSANLIGTSDNLGQTNLAIFSSVIHMGSNPPLFGFITRPTTVPRHTYQNIRDTGFYTINHIHEAIYQQAHQTSARYPQQVSEFGACGLTPEFTKTLAAPYVKESRIKLGMKWVEEHPIKANGTLLVVGEVLEILLDDAFIQEDGLIQISQTGTLAINGLDEYHQPQKIARLSYAKPDRAVEIVD